jgi:hypothetical protein
MDLLSNEVNETLRKISNKEFIKEEAFREMRLLLNAGLITRQYFGGWAITKKGIQYLIEHYIKAIPTSESPDNVFDFKPKG